MAVKMVDVTSTPEVWSDNETINLRRYIEILVRWWCEIAVITFGTIVLAVITILLLRAVTAAKYEASADVAIVRTVSDVKFDERFLTTSDDQTPTSTGLSARRTALMGMVTTGAIAQGVVEQLGDQLTVRERNATNLLEMVTVDMVSASGRSGDSDLIRIMVKADSPDKAVAIANAWAQTYVRQVNTVYGQVPNEVLQSIQTELAQAQKNYNTNQTNLEAFISSNRIAQLSGLVTVLQQRVDQEVSLLQAYLKQWQATMEQLSTAHALQIQVDQGGDGAARSTMAALQVLKLGTYGMPSEKLQVEVRDIPQVTQQAMLTDLDGLQKSLTNRLQDLEKQISARSSQLQQQEVMTTSVTSSDNALLAINQSYQELQKLKAQLEAENARQLQLTQQRDLSWETFKTLSTKVEELNLTRAAASSEVRLAAAAVPSIDPVSGPSLSLVTVLASTTGLILAIFVVLIAEYLGQSPFLRKEREKVRVEQIA